MEFGTKKAAPNRNVEKCGRCGNYILVTRKEPEVTCGSCGQKLKVHVVASLDGDESGSEGPVGEPVALDFVAPDVEAES